MRLNTITTFSQKKPTVFMDEKAEMQEDKERAILSIVHEIRNPLTAIKLTNQLMQEAVDRNEQDFLLMQSYLVMLEKNIERIEKCLKTVLTYQEKEMRSEPVNLSDCINQALYEAKDRLYLSGITVNSNYKGNYWVYGDGEKLVTAFLNIIINAIEAIKNEKGRIWINVYKTNNSVRITFKDNGVGMDPLVADKMFDPYFSTKDGMGIGLSGVKEIIKSHNASIVADSLPGIGTSVSILFSSIPDNEVPVKLKHIDGTSD